MKPIPSCPGYFATSKGQIITPRGKVMIGFLEGGYQRVSIKGRSPKVHHLVLEAFVGPRPCGMECRHLNDIKTDNRIENLKWGTRQENVSDKIKNGGQPRGDSSVASKLTSEKVLQCREAWPKESFRQLGKRFGVSHTAIRRAVLGIKWSHITQ